jgi:hypothetical protein
MLDMFYYKNKKDKIMATRRILKKLIKNVSSELIVELYFHCSTIEKPDEDKVDQLTLDVVSMNRDLVSRISHFPKNDTTEVKKYYRKLKQDWVEKLDTIISGITELSAEK